MPAQADNSPRVDYEPDPRQQPVCIVGAGAAGLITAHVLLQDGFTDVQVLTRDAAVGGVWMDGRVYPGVQTNSVHNQFSFSAMPMVEDASGSRLTGLDVQHYMATFAARFLEGKIRFNREVVQIRREDEDWLVDVRSMIGGVAETLRYTRVVVCTGGCSNPRVPESLSPAAAVAAGFIGPIVHTQDFAARQKEILVATKPGQDALGVVIVGGRRSAQDLSAYLANQGRKVSMVFNGTDSVIASRRRMPDFIRKSRLLSLFSPHPELRTWLERFLHTTWLGSKLVAAFWSCLDSEAHVALKIPSDSPLHGPTTFWNVANDEDTPTPGSMRFHALVNAGKISLVAPAHVDGFASDGRSVVLDNGEVLAADAVVLATGYDSSWAGLFDEKTRKELGIERRSPPPHTIRYRWDYKSLENGPHTAADAEAPGPAFVRGLVPARNIFRRDFAVNGAVLTAHNAMSCEVSAHWISAYFLRDALLLPSTMEQALEHGERQAQWMRQRYPGLLNSLNESYSTMAAVWDGPQWIDGLLEDMGLPIMRSGGNWLTWPFKVVRVQEVATLKEERDAQRTQVRIAKGRGRSARMYSKKP
ncbi:FAD/NAD-P-binding domain-containing protein [Auriscalpium vulgare]|uniref:FAD/NAD-P-binding domain-containing protein n=1 Tax=Auriscalpium vulgare TaxID=40419 RepID=A0ACB8S792_9AGAM|nr:FAD/NAD-P-binding domain-containing protein [Auriscalpium vulgare]